MAAEQAAKVAMENGMKSVDVLVKGPGAGREAAIRSLQAAGLEVSLIKDVTPILTMDVVRRNVAVFNFCFQSVPLFIFA